MTHPPPSPLAAKRIPAQCIGYGLGAMVPFLSGWLRSFFGNWHAPLVMLLVASLRQVVFAVLAGRNQFI